MISRLAVVTAQLSGWRRAAVSILAGITVAAALPPLHALPALWIGFPVFLWLLAGAGSWRRAALDGWSFGWGYFFAGLHWISFSLLVDGDTFAWLIPFALILIPAVLGLYVAGVAILIRKVAPGVPRLVALASAWALLEWLRGQLLTGFPWNPIAAVWAFDPAPMQILAFLGPWGAGFLTVMIAAAPSLLAEQNRWLRLGSLPAALAAVALVWAGGAWRLAVSDPANIDGVSLRIVQPNIPQHLKWKRHLRERHLATYLRLSRMQPATQPTHIIWPETAVPFILSRDDRIRQIMASVVPKGGLLLTGALRSGPRDEKPFRLWNSFQAIAPGGGIVASFDKFHLVPFGEYVPLRQWIGFAKITEGRTDFSRGPGPRTLDLPGLPPVSPLICYEIIFPDRLVDPVVRPQWILNVTNDAWFGESAGPWQHFALSRMRAVEQGLPVVRAANTGISGIIDPWGRVTASLDLGAQGFIDAPLPKAIQPTIYARTGPWPSLLLLFLILGACRFTLKGRSAAV